MNRFLTKLNREHRATKSVWFFLHGSCRAWSISSRSRADILPVEPGCLVTYMHINYSFVQCSIARLKFVVSFQFMTVAFFQNIQNIFSRRVNKSVINWACSGLYLEYIYPWSFLCGLRCSRSVLSRPQVDIYVPNTSLVSKTYVH